MPQGTACTHRELSQGLNLIIGQESERSDSGLKLGSGHSLQTQESPLALHSPRVQCLTLWLLELDKSMLRLNHTSTVALLNLMIRAI